MLKTEHTGLRLGTTETAMQPYTTGQCGLVFSGAAGFGSKTTLIWIIYNTTEPGYR